MNKVLLASRHNVLSSEQVASPVNVQAQAKQSKQANIGQSKQANIGLKSLANDCSNIQTDFDGVFADSFPDVVANFQSRINKELSENEEIAFCAQDTTFPLHSDDSGSHVSVQVQAKQAKSWFKPAERF